MEGERAAVHVRCGEGGDEGAGRTSKQAFRKRISSLHPHKEKYVIAGRQHYFGLLRGGGKCSSGAIQQCGRGAEMHVRRCGGVSRQPAAEAGRTSACVQNFLCKGQPPPPSDKTDAQQMASDRWYRSGPFPNCGAYLFAVHVLRVAFIRRGAAAPPEAGAANLRRWWKKGSIG